MTELSCAEARFLVVEYALGILEPALAHQMSRHIAACIACRHEVAETGAVGYRLLDLIPDAEPPLGFDRAVITTMRERPERRRRLRVLSGVGALVAAVGVVGGLTTLTGHQDVHPVELTAVFHQGAHPVGTVYIGGRPPWVTINVDHATLTGTVACQLVNRHGSATTVGDFQLVEGSGKWSAPEPAASSDIVGARLIAPDGTVMATASFTTSRSGDGD